MRITRLTAFHVRIPLRKTIRHASHSRDETDSIVVRCELEDGTVGWGEGLPRAYVTGEDIDAAVTILHETPFASQLGETFDGVPGAVRLCERMRLAVPPVGGWSARSASGICSRSEQTTLVRDCFGNSVRCAMELAVLDAACRAEGVPLSAVTALVPETMAIRQAQETVRYSGAITAMGPVKSVVTAAKMRLFGFRQCKVKVGVADNDDAALLRRVRRVLGPTVDVRIDANEAWTCDTLEAQLAPLLPFGINAVEQPVPHAEVDGLAAIRPRLSVPVMLDESLCSLADGERAIERGLCDLFNIRLSKCGGFVPSLRLAALAHRAGLEHQLGCQVGETGILSAAGRHFATSVAGIRYLEGSYDRFLVRERLTVEDLTFGYGGVAPALAGPGLGITVDERAVARVTVQEIDCLRT